MVGLFAGSAAIRLVGIALLLAGLFGGGYWRGHDAATTACEAARAKELEEHLNELALETQRADQIAREFADWQREHAPKRSGYFRAAGDLDACNHVPSGLVRLYNESASGLPGTQATAELNCTASAAATDTVATVIAENNAACVDYARQLDALIDWAEGK
jgi:hypothetical protein